MTMLGLKIKATHVVTESDLATNWNNPVPVLATPILVWKSELACMEVVEGRIGRDQMTLGYGHNITHIAPTPLGASYYILAELICIDEKLMTFSVAAFDDQEKIFLGQHVRALVDKARFLEKVRQKSESLDRV